VQVIDYIEDAFEAYVRGLSGIDRFGIILKIEGLSISFLDRRLNETIRIFPDFGVLVCNGAGASGDPGQREL
jgi:hypothetical protein